MQLELLPTKFIFHGKDGQVLVTLHPDGRVELGEGVTIDDATRTFWDAVESAGFERMNDAIRDLTRKLEEAGVALAAKEEKRALRDRLAHEHQDAAQRFYEQLEALKAETLNAINSMEEGWRGTKLFELHARLSRVDQDGETS